MTKDEALMLALETLEDIFGKNKVDVPAINAIRKALEQPDEEPVAYVTDNYSRDGVNDEISVYLPVETKLYTSPPKREPEPEPVADVLLYEYSGVAKNGVFFEAVLREGATVSDGDKLYTYPPHRTWQGLTDEEIELAFYEFDNARSYIVSFARAIEAKLKEKNT